jgi:DHA1 family bicyclomycin/chloramphenicol resistance-like MFS transporter
MSASDTPSAAAPAGAEYSRGRTALVLGLVSLSGPMAINMYVPAFQHIAASLGTDTATVQLSVVSFLAALAIGQNVYGPLSDRFGRKALLYAGMAVFIAGSLAASSSTTIHQLIGWRFVQGLGVCAAMAIPRAIVRDLHTGPEAARLLALMILVGSIAPLLAPLAGSAFAALLSWRAIFWFLAGAGCVALLFVFFLLPETCPPERRTPLRLATMIGNYNLLLRDREFMSLTMVTSFAQSSFFAFLGGSPFVFLSLHGLQPWQYSVIYSVGAAAWAGSAQFAAPLMTRLGPARLVKSAARAAALVTLGLLLGTAMEVGGLWLLSIGTALLFASIGIMMPAVTVLALHPHGAAAGTASAMMGTLGFATGAIASALVTALADGTAMPMVSVMTVCTFAALGTAWLAFVPHRPLREPSH